MKGDRGWAKSTNRFESFEEEDDQKNGENRKKIKIKKVFFLKNFKFFNIGINGITRKVNKGQRVEMMWLSTRIRGLNEQLSRR